MPQNNCNSKAQLYITLVNGPTFKQACQSRHNYSCWIGQSIASHNRPVNYEYQQNGWICQSNTSGCIIRVKISGYCILLVLRAGNGNSPLSQGRVLAGNIYRKTKGGSQKRDHQTQSYHIWVPNWTLSCPCRIARHPEKESVFQEQNEESRLVLTPEVLGMPTQADIWTNTCRRRVLSKQ